MEFLPLFPFHLHLRWPDGISGLSLAASIGFAPFHRGEVLVDETRIYAVQECCQARAAARVRRHAENRVLKNDLTLTDWERAADRNPRLKSLRLPGEAFVAVDSVSDSGEIKPGRRRVFGRRVPKGTFRPRILVPGRGGISGTSLPAYEELDLLILDAQVLRGRTAAQAVRTLGAMPSVPAIVVASSIGDLFAVQADEVPGLSAYELYQNRLRPAAIRTEIVGADRPSVEREFEFAIADLQGKNPRVDHVLELGRLAWWSVRNSPIPAEVMELRRFLVNLDRLAEDSPNDAAMLTALRQLLVREASRTDLRDERLQPVLNAVAQSRENSNIVVLVRNSQTAREVSAEIAGTLGLNTQELRELGVFVESVYAQAELDDVGACIVAGWFGTMTLDAALALNPSVIRFILDPLEARAAFLTAQRAVGVFDRLGIKDAQSRVQAIARALEPEVIGFTDPIDIWLGFDLRECTTGRAAGTSKPQAGEIGLYFTDGTRLDIAQHARLDVLGQGAKQLKPLMANQLRPGDRVVLLDEDSQAIFSERLLAEVDAGPLAVHAQHRTNWKAIVGAVNALKKPSADALLNAMSDAGEIVDKATIRSWIPSSDGSASVPDTWQRFLAFAKALGLEITVETLREMYDSIHRCRVAHRTLGRELARAIRGAYVGRLSAESLAKIERLCGVTARQLVAGVRVFTIDEILHPVEVTNATS